jgi:hypothetical protein
LDQVGKEAHQQTTLQVIFHNTAPIAAPYSLTSQIHVASQRSLHRSQKSMRRYLMAFLGLACTNSLPHGKLMVTSYVRSSITCNALRVSRITGNISGANGVRSPSTNHHLWILHATHSNESLSTTLMQLQRSTLMLPFPNHPRSGFPTNTASRSKGCENTTNVVQEIAHARVNPALSFSELACLQMYLCMRPFSIHRAGHATPFAPKGSKHKTPSKCGPEQKCGVGDSSPQWLHCCVRGIKQQAVQLFRASLQPWRYSAEHVWLSYQVSIVLHEVGRLNESKIENACCRKSQPCFI